MITIRDIEWNVEALANIIFGGSKIVGGSFIKNGRDEKT